MVKISSPSRINVEQLKSLPDDVKQIMVLPLNSLNEEISNAFKSQFTFADNMMATVKTQSFTDGVMLTVATGLKSPPIGIIPVWTDNANGFPRLALTYQADQSQIGITATFNSPQTYLGPISRLRSAATSLSTGVAVNVCTTTSLTLTAGDWDVRGYVGWNFAGTTTVNYLRGAISSTSATLPANDTIAVPTSGQVRTQLSYPATTVPGGVDDTVTMIERVSVAAGATLPLYLVADAVFGVAACVVYGSMEARLITGPAGGQTGNVMFILVGG